MDKLQYRYTMSLKPTFISTLFNTFNAILIYLLRHFYVFKFLYAYLILAGAILHILASH